MNTEAETLEITYPTLWREPKVCEVTGLTRQGIKNRERAGTFPKQVALDGRQKAYVATEVIAWVNSLLADRDAGRVPATRAAIEAARARGGVNSALRNKRLRSVG